jgi:hypothetical protein
MQGLSLEHLEGSQPLPTSTLEGSPRQSEVSVVTRPQVERTHSLEHFRITNTREDFRLHPDSERRFMHANSSGDLIVVYSGSLTDPGNKILFGLRAFFVGTFLVQVHL